MAEPISLADRAGRIREDRRHAMALHPAAAVPPIWDRVVSALTFAYQVQAQHNTNHPADVAVRDALQGVVDRLEGKRWVS